MKMKNEQVIDIGSTKSELYGYELVWVQTPKSDKLFLSFVILESEATKNNVFYFSPIDMGRVNGERLVIVPLFNEDVDVSELFDLDDLGRPVDWWYKDFIPMSVN